MMKTQKILTEYTSTSSKLFSENLPLLLGGTVEIIDAKWQKYSGEQFASSIDLPTACCMFSVDKGYSGEGMFLLSKHDAILLSCTLSTYSEAVIEEKLTSLELGKEENDAFHELCNQLIGLMDQALNNILPEQTHIKKGDVHVIEKDDDVSKTFAGLVNEDYLIHFIYQFDLNNQQKFELRFFMSSSFIAQIGEGEVTEPETLSQGEMAAVVGPDDAKPDSTEKILMINIAQQEENGLEALLSEKNMQFEYITKVSALQQQVIQEKIKLIVIKAGEKIPVGVLLCRKLKMMLDTVPVSIWIEGRGWNAVLTLRAIKAGASYIIVLPLNRQIIGRKIRQLFL